MSQRYISISERSRHLAHGVYLYGCSDAEAESPDLQELAIQLQGQIFDQVMRRF